MPRAGHLAVGAIVGALAIGLGSGSVALLGAAAVAAGCARRAGRGPFGVALIPLGLGLILIGTRSLLTPIGPPAPGMPEGRGPWVAVVESVGAPRAGSRPAVLRLETGDGARLAATLPWFPPVGPSDRVSISGGVRPPPDGPYGEYLARIGVVGTLRVDVVALLPPEEGPARRLEELRRNAAEAIAAAIPEPEAGLAAGVLIGLRDRVDRTLAADFRTAGASHVVAISGWNIAIVASTLAAVAGGLDRRRRALLTTIAIVAYVAFVGPSASVVRAAAMAGIALLARELGRPGTAAAALGWAVTLLLLSDPAWIDDAGFRLSALATAGIIAWGSSWTRRLGGETPGRPRRWLAEVLGVSLAAQVATLPIVLNDFGRLSLVAPIVNLAVVPLVPPAMAAGAVALGGGLAAMAGLPTFVAAIAGVPAWALYGLIVACVRAGAAAPLASVELATPWDGFAAATSALLIVLGSRWGGRLLGAGGRQAGPKRVVAGPRSAAMLHRSQHSRASRFAAAGLAVAIGGLALAISHAPDGIARITVLDVGQGDAILVEGGRGGRLLVDGGPDPGRLLLALDERLPPWDHRVDAIVLTHPHEDHVAGLSLLVSRYQVDRVYEPGMTGPGPGYAAWDAVLAEPGASVRMALATGDRLAVDDIRLRVLWPDPGGVSVEPAATGKGINNISIVLLGEVRGQRFLLAGDMEEEVDPQLIARGLPRVDVLKVAHHGSRTATTEPFLEAIRPRIAIISVGRDNPYGHPAPETLDRLGSYAGRTYRTDLDGTVEVALDGLTLRVAAVAHGRDVTPETASLDLAPPRSEPGAADHLHSIPLPRPAPGTIEGLRSGLRYHLPDGGRIELGDRLATRRGPRAGRVARPARLRLGRRRVRHGRRVRGVPARAVALRRRPAGAVAARCRSGRPRPHPRRGRRAAGDRLDVRRRLARGPRRSRRAHAPLPGPQGPARRA